MTNQRILAVGAPPTFRQQIARAAGLEVEAVEWMPTVSAAESQLAERQAGPSVVVLSSAVKDLDAYGLAEFVGRSSPLTAVLLTRDRLGNGIVPAAMRAGIRDVIDLSRGGDELRQGLQRAIAWSESVRAARTTAAPEATAERGKVISVFSSKGGTGKTFVASNLAAALADESKQDTALVDLEFTLGDVFSYFGTEPARPLQDLIALGDSADRDATVRVGTHMDEHLWAYGSPPDPAGEGVGGEAMGQAIRAFRRHFVYTVVDGTASYNDASLAAFDLSDTILLVTSLDVVAARHMSMALETLLSLGFPRDRFRIVLNRAESKVKLEPSDVERVMRVTIDARIPASQIVPASLNVGWPVVLAQPRSDVARAIRSLARSFLPEEGSTQRKRRLFGRS